MDTSIGYIATQFTRFANPIGWEKCWCEWTINEIYMDLCFDVIKHSRVSGRSILSERLPSSVQLSSSVGWHVTPMFLYPSAPLSNKPVQLQPQHRNNNTHSKLTAKKRKLVYFFCIFLEDLDPYMVRHNVWFLNMTAKILVNWYSCTETRLPPVCVLHCLHVLCSSDSPLSATPTSLLVAIMTDDPLTRILIQSMAGKNQCAQF